MRVEKLALVQWRNYESESVELAPGLNLVVGANAQGKTNLLEAVYCLSGFGSPRSPEAALVKTGSDRALLHALVERRGRHVALDVEFQPGRGTRALINKTPVPGTKPLAELSVSVFFGPDELSLVKGSPEGRRGFLDQLTVKLRPSRDRLRTDFERTLKQRNALLRSAPHRGPAAMPSTLDAWDDAFTRTGASLVAARLEALAGLIPHAASRFAAIAAAGALELRYKSSWLDEAIAEKALAEPEMIDVDVVRGALSEALSEARPRELERGVSLVGPQRDDVAVTLATGSAAPLDARIYASQGDQRTAALALKLAEHDLLTAALGEEPVLLLDDVLSELDAHRRAWLAEAVRPLAQTIVSSAEPEGAHALAPANVIEVAGGRATVR